MREILSDEEKRAAQQIGEEAAEHFITSRSEYEKTNPSVWDADEEIVFNVDVDVPEESYDERKSERKEIRAFKNREREENKGAKHAERTADHIIDKGIRDEKRSVRRDIKELDRMEIQDRFSQFEETIKEKL